MKTSLLKSFIILIVVFFVENALAQYNCGNVGFELGNNTGWTGYVGECSAGATGSLFPTLSISNTPVVWTTPQKFTYTNPSIFNDKPQNILAIMTPDSGVNGYDPIVKEIPVVSPWGGTRSIRLGNSRGGHLAERIRFNYTVDASNASFVYQYAVLLQRGVGYSSAEHKPEERPSLRINITNSSGTLINPTCGVYNVYAGQDGLGFKNMKPNVPFITGYSIADSVSYRNWSLASIDLTPFIGQTVTIEFTTNDCIYTTHFGYAYIDCSCVPLSIATSYCSGAITADASAPDGYTKYEWYADAVVNYPPADNNTVPPTPAGPPIPIGNVITTSQICKIASNDTTTTFCVICVPYQGFQCATKLCYIFNPKPTLLADFDFIGYCGNDSSIFKETSQVLNGGAPPNKWLWDFGDGSSSTKKSPKHKYALKNQDTKYLVSLIIQAGTSCKDTLLDTINVPAGLLIDTLAPAGIFNVSCGGANDGKAIFHVTGAAGDSIKYHWTLPNPVSLKDSAVYGLPANNASFPIYKLIAEASGCSDTIEFKIKEPPPLIVTVDTNYILCKGSSQGTLDAIVSGGSPPYNYLWGTPPPQTTAKASKLLAGKYFVTVKDTNDCLSQVAGVLIDGSKIKYDFQVKPPTCYGNKDGSAEIKISGGKPQYNTIWQLGNAAPITKAGDSPKIIGLGKSNGFVIIQNQNKCDDDTIKFSIVEPDTMKAIFTSQNAACDSASNGTIKIDVVGGTKPYTYFWDTDHDFTLQGVSLLKSGYYKVIIKDKNKCTIEKIGKVSQDSNLVATAKPNFVYDEIADKSLWVKLNKLGHFKYEWTNEQFLDNNQIATPELNQLFSGMDFIVKVTDEFGCIAYDSVKVDVVPILFIPTAFTPNKDGNNDELQIVYTNYDIKNFSLIIYNRWGQKVYDFSNPKFKWDGKDYSNTDVPVGVYNYELTYSDNRNKRHTHKGSFNLIR